MPNIKVFLNNDDCRRFTVERCQEVVPQICTIFELDYNTFFNDHTVTLTQGAAGINNVSVPNHRELRTLFTLISQDHLETKPIVLRLTSSSRSEQSANVNAPTSTADAAVMAALNDAHVAALTQVDRAKARIVTVKEQNRQAMQQAREQAQRRLQEAQQVLNQAKVMACKTSLALKTVGGHTAPKQARMQKEQQQEQEQEQQGQAVVSDDTTAPKTVDEMFTVGEVVTLTPVGMTSRLRILPDDGVDAKGGNGRLVRFRVMARQGNLIMLAQNGRFLHMQGTKVTGQGRDFAAPWITLIKHDDQSVSLTTGKGAATTFLGVRNDDMRVQGLQGEPSTDFTVRFVVDPVASTKPHRRGRHHGQHQEQREQRIRGRGGLRHAMRHVAATDGNLKEALAHAMPGPNQPHQRRQHRHPEKAGEEEVQVDAQEAARLQRMRARICSQEIAQACLRQGSTPKQRLKLLDRQLTSLRALQAQMADQGSQAHMTGLHERIGILEQTRREVCESIAAHEAACKQAVQARQGLVPQALPINFGPAAGDRAVAPIDTEDAASDDGEWVQVPAMKQPAAIKDKQTIGFKTVNGSFVSAVPSQSGLFVSPDATKQTSFVVCAAGNDVLKFRSVNSGRFLRLGPHATSVDLRGSGGIWTEFKALTNEDGTVTLASMRRPNHFVTIENSNLIAREATTAVELGDAAKLVVCPME